MKRSGWNADYAAEDAGRASGRDGLPGHGRGDGQLAPARGAGGKSAAVKAPSTGDASDLIAAAKLGGAVAYVVMDAATGEVLEAREPDLRCRRPAWPRP
ncbi:MAG: hypothetical protein U1E58_00650 [Tabrizicola sp.]